MSKKLLIVDDELDFNEFLHEALEDYGYSVISVDCGENAISLVEKNFFDVILMDINMPGIDGVEAFKKIKKISPLSTVIMMTAGAPESMIKKAVEEGSFAVVHKPFKLSKVVDIINEAMKKTTVLVVDDQYTDREVLRDLLEQKGCKCVTVEDGQSAINVLQQGKPDLVLVDIKMPNMDGFTVLEKIKDMHPDVGVIMMTAYSKDEYLDKSMKMGALNCLYKPLNIERILETIEKQKKQDKKPSDLPKVLMIDDDKDLLKTMSAILKDNNFDVVTAENGNSAVDEGKKVLFDAAIVDYRLPDISGLVVIKKLKEINPNILIILMTGHESLDLALQALKQHIFDFLIKPVHPKDLVKSLNRGLSAKKKKK